MAAIVILTFYMTPHDLLEGSGGEGRGGGSRLLAPDLFLFGGTHEQAHELLEDVK